MSENTPEEWRPVVGYEGLYEVSDLGRVRSLDAFIPDKNGILKFHHGRLKKTTTRQWGHQTTILHGENGPRNERIHRLVLRAFKGEPPDGKPLGLHNDGNAKNNQVGNLRWGDQKENIQDAIRHGTFSNQNTGKTHCKEGHEFTPENTYVKPSTGFRRCRKCALETSRREGRTPIPADSRFHGTLSGYSRFNCRCEPCREAKRVNRSKNNRRKND